MATSKYAGPSEKLKLYEVAVAGAGDMELKGATMPYTSRNGHMTSFLDNEGSVGLRLSPDDRTEFLERYESRVAVQHGKEMKEFVVVPADLLPQTEELGEWLARSRDWAGTLKPKPPKK